MGKLIYSPYNRKTCHLLKKKVAAAKVDKAKVYSLKEASTLVKEINCTKFDSSVDLHIRLGVDPKKADQQVRGTVSLPHGTGKTKKVLVLCTPDKEAAAKKQVPIILVWTSSSPKLKAVG